MAMAVMVWTAAAVLIGGTQTVHAYYCDHNRCNSEQVYRDRETQFCCGENICCDYVNNTIWHLICYLISFMVFGFVLWTVYQLISGFITAATAVEKQRDVLRKIPQDIEQQRNPMLYPVMTDRSSSSSSSSDEDHRMI